MASRLAAWVLLAAGSMLAEEPQQWTLAPPGGGQFAITLSACSGGAAVLNGALANQTDDTWLYVEIQVKVSKAGAASTYRFNLERIGPKGIAIKQRIEGPANQDCTAYRIDGVELISAYSETRAARKR